MKSKIKPDRRIKNPAPICPYSSLPDLLGGGTESTRPTILQMISVTPW